MKVNKMSNLLLETNTRLKTKKKWIQEEKMPKNEPLEISTLYYL